MATTTNYGWSEPDNTSLVKNGAQDIRILGDAIDASVWNVGYGQAGKNKIINGDFSIWQRGTSFSVAGLGDVFTADRIKCTSVGSGTGSTVSRQTFTPATAPVAGYEGQYFLRYNQTAAGSGNAYNYYFMSLEDVRTFAGQTATFSFWAKADASRAISLSYYQNFGSGGSTTVTTTVTASQTITTAWVRYSFTTAIPSISGKTIGTSSYLGIFIGVPAGVANTVDLWGLQLEYGSKATPFQTASGGSPQAELAMCQRYYQRFTAAAPNYYIGGRGNAASTTSCIMQFAPLVTMRTTPATLDYSNLLIYDEVVAPVVSVATIAALANPTLLQATLTSTALVQYRNYTTVSASGTAGYIGFSAEL